VSVSDTAIATIRFEEEDWALIAHAFAANDDPLIDNNRRMEFSRQYDQFVVLVPRKLKFGLCAAKLPPPRPPQIRYIGS
jgi:hypothetical protein